MPLIKRILHDSDVYEQAYGELCEDTPPQQLIGNHNMSKILGVLLELSYLTAYSVEVSCCLFACLLADPDMLY
jgi:hypothetical protein